jgi:hypothetical protein
MNWSSIFWKGPRMESCSVEWLLLWSNFLTDCKQNRNFAWARSFTIQLFFDIMEKSNHFVWMWLWTQNPILNITLLFVHLLSLAPHSYVLKERWVYKRPSLGIASRDFLGQCWIWQAKTRKLMQGEKALKLWTLIWLKWFKDATHTFLK